MTLKKIKLGKYIELYSERCNVANLTNDDISGVNKEKEFFEPSNQVGSDTSAYKIVPPKHFACNLMHVGRDVVLPIAYNHSQKNKIVSPAYFVFKFKDNNEILSDYFFIYLKSEERDRYFWFNTDSSIRDGMSWDDFINVEIELPPIDIQQKYVDIYNAMLENQKCYERGLDDLKLVCDANIDKYKHNSANEFIGKLIEPVSETNSGLIYTSNDVIGMTITKEIIPTKADINKTDLSKFVVVKPNEFVYNPRTHGKKIGFGYNNTNKTFIISWNNIAFRIKSSKKNIILSDYLFLHFKRDEWDRAACFQSWGSSTEVFSWDTLCEMDIPIPSLEIQQDIVNIYNAYNERKEINETLKAQIKDICPILIKGSIEEARKSA